MDSIEDLVARSLADKAQELHARNFELLAGQMIACMGVHHFRRLLLDLAADLEEFDKGES